MMEWMYQKLGIKRYWVCYRFPSALVPRKYVEGRVGPMFRFEAELVAAESNVRFSGCHWVEGLQPDPATLRRRTYGPYTGKLAKPPRR